MDALEDSNWLLGDPSWWNLEDKLPPDLRNGELIPPESWIYSSPREGSKGWKRQRLKPLAYKILKPISWSLFFLTIVPVPLIFPGNTPDDQLFALVFFIISWTLIIYPLENSRTHQNSSINGLLSLPIDWISLLIGFIIFPIHIFVDPRIGWISYFIFWFAMFRTIIKIQTMMKIPPARFLLPIIPRDWNSNVLNGQWSIKTNKWKNGIMANSFFKEGMLMISGLSRGENKFISFCFVHKTGFIHDPFYDRDTNDEKLYKILQKPPLIEGLIWPERFLVTLEEE
ncbi:MAG: hypothetical protein ACJZ4F_04160 [Candidatus Thalassarchaeaceae archaeon]